MTTPTILARLRTEVEDALAVHGEAKSLQTFGRYRDDPAGFFRDVLRCEPWSKQLEMADLVRDHPRTCVVSANGIGKDWLAARLALWWCFSRHGFAILTSASERQVKNILMREVRRAFTRTPELPGTLYQLELRVDDGCGILAFTSDRADRLVGFHHPQLLICLSEGQGIEPMAWEAAAACATAPGNRILVYGNPAAATGPFYTAATSATWATLRIRADEHPNVISGRQEIPGAVSVEWVTHMAEEYGRGSPIYRARVLAEFAEDSLDGLVTRAWVRRAMDAHVTGRLDDLAVWRPVFIGLDVARFGADASAAAVIQGPVCQEIRTWHGLDTVQTASRAIEIAERHRYQVQRHALEWHRPRIVVDAIGVGAGVADELRRRGWSPVEFNSGHRALDDTQFFNLRSEAHWCVRSLLEKGSIALPDDPVLMDELLATEYQITPGGKVQMMAKEQIRDKLGHSPDRLDAVVMAFAYAGGKLRHGATTHAVAM